MKLDFCVACGSRKGLDHHHLIPESRGGKTISSNLITLCHKHHMALHEMGGGKVKHAELVREGIARAASSGKILGRKPAPLSAFVLSESRRTLPDTILIHLYAVDGLAPYLISGIRWLDVVDGHLVTEKYGVHPISDTTMRLIRKHLTNPDIKIDSQIVPPLYKTRGTKISLPASIAKRLERLKTS